MQCPTFHATLSAAACVRRHCATIASGRGRGSVLEGYETCARCALGEGRRKQLARVGYEPPPHKAFSVSKTIAFGEALRRAGREGLLDEQWTVDGAPRERSDID